MNTLNNSVRPTGLLGGVPEIKVTGNKKKFATINLTTKSFRKNNNGQRVGRITWHKNVLWKAGVKHNVTEIIVNKLDFSANAHQN